jgi:hypothetical protein
MGAPELKVSYRPDDDGTGEVIAVATVGAFSARGSAWVGRVHVKQTFLTALRTFPLTPADPPLVEGGVWNGSGLLDQCFLRITVKPYDLRGRLLVHAELASEVWVPEDADLQNRASVRFLTEYAAVDRFAEEFEQVLDGKLEVAILKGIAS